MVALMIAIAFVIVSILIILLTARNTPLGWEDERGFHYGDRPQ